ncbi:universal stress protein [Haloarcula montana]|uniref:universal stress protein n=1 Tax=Haloarcula montana TaxID=3111776 RepID=UPI002D769F8A|nr:universal stress protein [Haloarcula sp. GH36]
MPEPLVDPTILVPIDASDTGEPSDALVKLLRPHQLVVLGYYPVPDQTATEQAREQFGEAATADIEAIADRFAEHGAGVESVVVFTHDRSQTIDNIAAEYDADAVLTPGIVGDTLDRILVPVRGDSNLARILGFVGGLLRGSDATATMYHVADAEADASHGELLVRGAADRLTEDEGIEGHRVDWRNERAGSTADAIIEAAEEYDLLIVGESEPSLTERILGDVTDTVIDKSSDPLLIVRNR